MKTRVLMVCLGNICRSPLAEGILKSKDDPKKVSIDSAGTGSWHVDHLPDPRSISVGKRYGVDITGQRGRQFEQADFDSFDPNYVIDNSNYEDVIAQARNEEDKNDAQLILDPISPGEKVDVTDAYHGGEHGFEDV